MSGNLNPSYLKLSLRSVACLLLLLAKLTEAQTVHASRLKVVYAVNAGGREHTDKHGIHYVADPLQNKIGTASDYGNHLLIIGRVPEQDEILFRTERYHTASFGYELPIDGDGQYALIMKFCEVYFSEPNMKVFDVVLNKKHTIVSELDIFHQVGRGTAHEEYAFFNIANGLLYYKEEVSDVRNGVIRLDFIKGHFDNPKINAFALLKGDVEHIPRLSPISDDILPMDADMAVFRDRVSADSGPHAQLQPTPRTVAAPTVQQPIAIAHNNNDEDNDFLEDTEEDDTATAHLSKVRKTSGPRQPNPYTMDESSVMLPMFIAIGAFIPLLFCLCKL